LVRIDIVAGEIAMKMFVSRFVVCLAVPVLLPAGFLMAAEVRPLSQEGRPPCSVPLEPSDLQTANVNWMGGLLAKSQWIWTGHLTGSAFDNNMGRFFLQMPAVFEEQLHYSASLIFDDSSFRNGLRMSGFVDRVTRELVISYIAQRRRSWYSMTHHALIGTLTGRRHGLTDDEIAAKWSHLLEYRDHPEIYTRVERAALRFAEAFAENPKSYTDADSQELRAALSEFNHRRFDEEDAWMMKQQVARQAYARALGLGNSPEEAEVRAREAVKNAVLEHSEEQNEFIVNAQVLELAFLSLQFVAVTDVFTALNIPDEEPFAQVMVKHVPAKVITKINELNGLGGEGMGEIIPPRVDIPLDAILAGRLRVGPSPLTGARVPLDSWETNTELATRDKGLAVGGILSGVFGWGQGNFGGTGGLVSLVLNHPELARHQPPYSLCLLFNEDEWRNGVQTSGFVDRRLKELTIMKAYRLTRNRYGVEHHSLYLLLEYLADYAANDPALDADQRAAAAQRATEAYLDAILHLLDNDKYPDSFDDTEMALLSWVDAVVTRPHKAHKLEPALRRALDKRNRREVAAGIRRLDRHPNLDDNRAFKRLLDHQISELAMIAGHMDGLGRTFSILNIEGEPGARIAEGEMAADGRLKPELDDDGYLQITGHWINRNDWFTVYNAMLPAEIITANELLLNPKLNKKVKAKLAAGKDEIRVTSDEAKKTAEF
jgi:alkylhydroperoxidase family enzyme